MYLAFESSVESRSKLLATAFALSIVYGFVVRVPDVTRLSVSQRSLSRFQQNATQGFHGGQCFASRARM